MGKKNDVPPRLAKMDAPIKKKKKPKGSGNQNAVGKAK